MAKKRDDYIVPMPLERTVDRIHHIIDLGIQIEIEQIDADTVTYVARRMKPRRGGGLRVVDESRGQMSRVEDDHTRVEPITRTVANWQLAIFYLIVVLLGLLLAGALASATAGMFSGFWQRALATLIVYGALFFLLQPQRFVFGSARDSRFDDFIHDVLKGPYADPKNLYEQYFTEVHYWETRGSQ